MYTLIHLTYTPNLKGIARHGVGLWISALSMLTESLRSAWVGCRVSVPGYSQIYRIKTALLTTKDNRHRLRQSVLWLHRLANFILQTSLLPWLHYYSLFVDISGDGRKQMIKYLSKVVDILVSGEAENRTTSFIIRACILIALKPTLCTVKSHYKCF